MLSFAMFEANFEFGQFDSNSTLIAEIPSSGPSTELYNMYTIFSCVSCSISSNVNWSVVCSIITSFDSCCLIVKKFYNVM